MVAAAAHADDDWASFDGWDGHCPHVDSSNENHDYDYSTYNEGELDGWELFTTPEGAEPQVQVVCIMTNFGEDDWGWAFHVLVDGKSIGKCNYTDGRNSLFITTDPPSEGPITEWPEEVKVTGVAWLNIDGPIPWKEGVTLKDYFEDGDDDDDYVMDFWWYVYSLDGEVHAKHIEQEFASDGTLDQSTTTTVESTTFSPQTPAQAAVGGVPGP